MPRTPGLAIGPENVDQAGELVADLGVHNLADRLLDRHAQLYPLPLVQALGRPRDDDRSTSLDLEEVQEVLKDQTGRRAFFKDGYVLEDAAVKGDTPDNRVVSVVFRNPVTGRSGRGVLPYEAFEAAERRHLEKQQALAQAQLAPGQVDPQFSAASAATSDAATEQRLQELERRFRQAEQARAEVQDELDKLRDPEPWEGYADSNQDAIVARLESEDGGLAEFGRAGLERIQAYEEQHKARKGVLNSVDAQLAKAR